MPGKFLFVVGDNLASRARSADLVPLSRFESVLDEELASGPPPVVVPGQGIDLYQREILRHALLRRGLPQSLLADVTLPEPLPHTEVHKSDPGNVLVSGLRQVGEDRFEAFLRIADRQELLLDHTTGSHVPGMVIAEAVRQLSLAVGERYLLDPARTTRSRFILNSLQTSFHKFLLPLPTRLEFTLEDVRRKGPNKVRYLGRCDVFQTDVLAASGTIDLMVMDESRAEQLEARHIDAMTRALISAEGRSALEEREDYASRIALSRAGTS